MRWPKINGTVVRDVIIFSIGVGGIIHETLSPDPPRDTLLILFATMIGLPAFLRSGEDKNNRSNRDNKPKRKYGP